MFFYIYLDSLIYLPIEFRSYLLNDLSIYFIYELFKKGVNIIQYIHIIQYTEVININTTKQIIKRTKRYKIFKDFTTLINMILFVRRIIFIFILKVFL